jgi:hypothetical protein
VSQTPILYFPRRPTKTNVTLAGGYLPAVTAPPLGKNGSAMYDPADNVQQFVQLSDTDARAPQWRIHAMLGDFDTNAVIASTANESVLYDGPYILWASGPDGLFGPEKITDGSNPTTNIKNRDAVAACDDVTNIPK